MLDTYLLGQWDTAASTSTDENMHDDDNETENIQRSNDLPALAMESARSWLADVLIALGICAEVRGGCTSPPAFQLLPRF
jgi:hypothetical protein